MPRRVYIKTFGCQMNERDSERMLALAASSGYAPARVPEEADLILINTCTVRRKPEHKVYSLLGRLERLKRTRPELKIGVAGCLAQQEGPALLERFPGIDFVLGPDKIRHLPRILGELGENGKRPCIVGFEEEPSQGVLLPLQRKVRAYVNVMQGCDNYCAYCIVPYVRGPEKSRPSGEILEEVRLLAERGVKEVMLLGQNVNAYGKRPPDLTFPQLLAKINEIEGIERIRFVTSHPRDLSDELIEAFGKLEKLCEQIHLPFQSGSDRILQRMGRGYSREDYLEKVRKLRDAVPRIAITADAIVGFPGEREEDFEDTLRLIEEVEFDGLFSFKYSPRKGTRASRWVDDVPPEEKQRRLEALQALQRSITLKKNRDLEGKVMEVLVEGKGKGEGQMMGRTRCFRVVNFPGEESMVGKLLRVKITEGLQNSLRGEPVA